MWLIDKHYGYFSENISDIILNKSTSVSAIEF
jgi:hypothetical protein